MLFECAVCSVSDYGAEIWGFAPKDAFTKIHVRAARCFLGLPKSATTAGVLAEINWTEPVFMSQVRMIRHYFRVNQLECSRLTKRVLEWDKSFSELNNLSTWSSEIKYILNTHNLLHYFDSDLAFCIKSTISKLQQSMFVQQSVDLKNRCLEKQKLRTFITFKELGTTPSYISMPMSFITR